MDYLEGNSSNEISVLKDPFKKDCVESISIHCFRAESIFNNQDYKYYFNGTVKFENGNTKGSQKFEGSDFKDLVSQMESFMGTMK